LIVIGGKNAGTAQLDAIARDSGTPASEFHTVKTPSAAWIAVQTKPAGQCQSSK
jgi:hypothetical protein